MLTTRLGTEKCLYLGLFNSPYIATRFGVPDWCSFGHHKHWFCLYLDPLTSSNDTGRQVKEIVKIYLDSFTYLDLFKRACLRHRQMTVPVAVWKFLYVEICLKHRLFVPIREDIYIYINVCVCIYLNLRESSGEGTSRCFAKTCWPYSVGRQTYIYFLLCRLLWRWYHVGLSTRFSEKQMNLAAPYSSSHQASTSSCRSQRSNHPVLQGKASLVGQA